MNREWQAGESVQLRERHPAVRRLVEWFCPTMRIPVTDYIGVTAHVIDTTGVGAVVIEFPCGDVRAFPSDALDRCGEQLALEL